MADRRDALKSYLLEVIRDLVQRGVVRQHAGQPLADVLRTEPRTVLNEMVADLAHVSVEVGSGLSSGLGVMLKNQIGGHLGDVAEIGGRAFADWLIGFSGKKQR